jgi:hypothetical protein
MAQVKLLKIGSDGIPLEHTAASDELSMATFTVPGGPVLSVSGLDMNNTDVSDVQDIVFLSPSTATINQTVGNLIIDDIMAVDRDNDMAAASSITFPVIGDVAGQVDAFRAPALAGVPTASPASGGAGHIVFDSSNKNLFVWDGAAWDNLSTAKNAEALKNYYTAGEGLAARDVLYISSDDTVSKANASTDAKAKVIGFAVASASSAAPVEVQDGGVMEGFSGLTAGSRYYLGTTDGAISTTVPSGTGHTIVQVGYARSASKLHVQIETLGRRA